MVAARGAPYWFESLQGPNNTSAVSAIILISSFLSFPFVHVIVSHSETNARKEEVLVINVAVGYK